jgi:hypothetical protein
MSDVARRARGLAGEIFPKHRDDPPPSLERVEDALTQLRQLRPKDAEDQQALHEAGHMLNRLHSSMGAEL